MPAGPATKTPTMQTPANLPQIIAHRGNAAEFPENTLPALDSAVSLGLRHVEFDVQLTADFVPVLMHDADLQRVAGRPESVHDLTWSALSEIPVGEVARLGNAHAFTCPPSLAQAVDAVTGWAGVTAFVEVKRSSLRRFGREAVLTRIANVLRPALDRCVLISFDLPTLKILRAMTGARIGWVLSQYDEAARAEATQLAPDFLFANLERLPVEPEPLFAGPWQWALYEVRDLKTAQACHARGAQFVETMAVRGLLHAYAESRHRW
jgi:glycerophosphoryl diester phosphodiesterase